MYYLMTTFIHEIRICRPGLRDGPMFLPTISFDWACPQNIFFLSSSDGYGSLGTFTIHVPQLSYGVWALFGFLSIRDLLVKKPLWVIIRPHLIHQNKKSILKFQLDGKINVAKQWRGGEEWTWISWSLRKGWSKAGWWEMWTQSIISPSGLCIWPFKTKLQTFVKSPGHLYHY